MARKAKWKKTGTTDPRYKLRTKLGEAVIYKSRVVEVRPELRIQTLWALALKVPPGSEILREHHTGPQGVWVPIPGYSRTPVPQKTEAEKYIGREIR